MRNSITIHIGVKDPREYWDAMEAQLFNLYTTCKKKGWIGKESDRDKETSDFFMDFLTRLHEQKPPRIKR
jgi:hypothetical protein